MDDTMYRCLLLLCFAIIGALIVYYEAFWEKREREAQKKHEARMQELRDWEAFFKYLDEQSYFMSESNYRGRLSRVDIDTENKIEREEK